LEEKKNSAEEQPLSNTDLAYERTMLAENRTLMAWIRTAISMISFGFTIYKFFYGLAQSSDTAVAAHKLLSPRKIGMMMIAFGLLALIWGLMEHNAMVKKLRRSYPQLERSKTGLLALLTLLLGLVLFLAALFRQ
jgi:putative membrane protein